MPVQMVKTSQGMKPVSGDKLVLEEEGLRVVGTVAYAAGPVRDPTQKRPGLIRRLLARLFKPKV